MLTQAAEQKITRVAEGYQYAFSAMASACYVLINTDDAGLALQLGGIAESEARRIEAKYSRYRIDSLVWHINAANGRTLDLDEETASLLDYADMCYNISGGKFDITAGILRHIWHFDGSDTLPTRQQVRALLPQIGWNKVRWSRPQLMLPPGMEIDLGGMGKEYAVDCALLKVQAVSRAPVLVNFGGDLRVSGPMVTGARWRIAIDAVDQGHGTEGVLEIGTGALTTSGDSRRYLLRSGVRYGHILDPRTGWPVKNPPRSVTVAAATCMEAGILSTLAMLQGAQAEAFLKREAVQSWCIRPERTPPFVPGSTAQATSFDR